MAAVKTLKTSELVTIALIITLYDGFTKVLAPPTLAQFDFKFECKLKRG